MKMLSIILLTTFVFLLVINISYASTTIGQSRPSLIEIKNWDIKADGDEILIDAYANKIEDKYSEFCFRSDYLELYKIQKKSKIEDVKDIKIKILDSKKTLITEKSSIDFSKIDSIPQCFTATYDKWEDGMSFKVGDNSISVNSFTGDPNLVALYRFEKANLTIDSIGNNHMLNNTVMITYPVRSSDSKEGFYSSDFETSWDNGFQLNDTYLDAGFPFKNGDTVKNGSFTVWVKPESCNEKRSIIGKTPTPGRGTFHLLLPEDGTCNVTFHWHTSLYTEEIFTHGKALTLGNWYHIGLTMNSNRSFRVRIWDETNQQILGEDLVGSATNDLYLSDSHWVIGLQGPDNPYRSWDGLMDELAVFNKVLTVDEIDQIRNATYDNILPLMNFTSPTPSNATTQTNGWVEINFTVNETNVQKITYNWNGTNYTLFNESLVLMYNFQNLSELGEEDTIAVDISGNGNDGTVNNANWTSDGKYGGAFDFDGDDYIESNYAPVLSSSDDFSITVWIKPANTARAADETIWGSQTWDGATAYPYIDAEIDGDGSTCDDEEMSLRIRDALYSGNDGVCTTTAFTTTDWYHIAYTYDVNGNIVVYVNGIQEGSTAVTSDSNGEKDWATYGPSWNFGRYIQYGGASSQFFNGTIDEVAIWNKSLSAEEIYQNYISTLQKFDFDKWYFYINQSLNASDTLPNGDYTYYGCVEEIKGNINCTETREITIGEVADTTPPTYSLNQTNSTANGTDIMHSLQWQDDTGLDGYIFSFCNGTWNGSECLTTTEEANLYLSTSIEDDDDYQGGAVAICYADDDEYKIYCGIKYDISSLPDSFNIINIIHKLRTGNTETLDATDKVEVYCVLNDTWNEEDGFTSSIITNNGYLMYTIDDLDGRGSTWYSDNNSKLGDCIANVTEQGLNYVTFGYTVEDDADSTENYFSWATKESSYDQILNITYTLPPTGGWQNDSFVPMTGTLNWSNVTKRIQSTVGLNYSWCVYANDTTGNWNTTSCDNPFTYTSGEEVIPPSDTCSCPASGNWNIDCSDNCLISSDCDMQGNDIHTYGTGSLDITAKIYNFGFFSVRCKSDMLSCRNTPTCFG